ncbi:MAG TPA: DUF1801 domain-containing protein [Pseudomonadales bacterium]|jgi:uncharacterized protein YdhG (YjbR/CyaY superfamily)|nr:DUF1801 domain-containing protein [Pseudomonadales bacterium]
MRAQFATVDEYIAAFPAEIRRILRRIRATVRKAAPGAQERISYGMPSFTQGRTLVYYAAFTNHIGLYPPVKGDAKLRTQIARYANEKGNLKFPLDEPIPYALIGRIVKARVKENRATADARKKKR